MQTVHYMANMGLTRKPETPAPAGPRLEVTAGAYPVAGALRNIGLLVAFVRVGELDLRVTLTGGAHVDLVDRIPEISSSVVVYDAAGDPDLLATLYQELAAVIPWSIARYGGAGLLIEQQLGRRMSSLEDEMGLVPVEFASPEEMTRVRRKANAELGITRGPSHHELGFYARQGKTPPTD